MMTKSAATANAQILGGEQRTLGNKVGCGMGKIWKMTDGKDLKVRDHPESQK